MKADAAATKPTALEAGDAFEPKPRRRSHFARVDPAVLLLGTASIGIGFAAWAVLSHLVVPDTVLPTPAEVVNRFSGESGELAENFRLTFQRTLTAFAIGSSAGFLVALITSWSRRIDRFTEPLIQVFKPVPALVLVPFMIIWFGAEGSAAMSLATWGCFFLMVVEAREAIRNTPRLQRWAAATLGASSWSVHLRVMLPSALPHLVGALRVNMIIALNLVIIAEFSIASGGLGDVIVRGYRFLHPDLLFFGIAVTVGFAFLLDRAIRAGGRAMARGL